MKLLKKILYSFCVFLFISIMYFLFLKYFVENKLNESVNLDLWDSIWRFFTIKILDGNHVNIITLTLSTLYYFIVNFLIATVFGVLFGTILGKFRTIGNISNYFTNFFRVMPSIIFIVLFKYQFKFYDSYIYYVGFVASVWPILINTKSGVEKVNITLRESISILNVPFFKKIFWFILPEAFPNIWDGMKIGLGISFLITITCEYLNPDLLGLGALLKSYQTDNIFPLVTMCIILWIGFVGLLINLIFEFIETKILWLNKQFSTNE